MLLQSNPSVWLLVAPAVVLLVAAAATDVVIDDAREHAAGDPTLWGAAVGGLLVAGVLPGLFALGVYLLGRE
jgi:hypothetical protein